MVVRGLIQGYKSEFILITLLILFNINNTINVVNSEMLP